MFKNEIVGIENTIIRIRIWKLIGHVLRLMNCIKMGTRREEETRTTTGDVEK
jgi:hypothetical protein